ncbi:hypothetical protein OB955_16800 [Halobacteria archaeon AArc-m2/3/4]|uniref:SipW-cognate class signal peptide n=1 Tax=Natronoglomus mannanivorans TaxID=2979990 RepID=A0ABT2QHI5_9EURY|nr:hypothetical protein [Halobacteria archaeon AArc-m2/3/4]
MKMNRRNVLLGLGTVVAGGGAALGTGAFSSVEAQRTISVDTTGDSDALIGISLTGDLDGGSDTIEFDLENDLNLNAVTTFSSALTITNNRESETDDVDIDIRDGFGGSSLIAAPTNDGGLQFEVETGSKDNLAGDGGEVVFNVVFGLVGKHSSGGSPEIPENIVIEASDSN